MRKFFEGQTPLSLVLIFSTFLFACFLRLFDLDSQSPWTDEVASWFYLRHLDLVFSQESHSPLYYAFSRLILGKEATMHGLRLFSGFVSVAHLSVAFVLAKKVFSRPQLLLFWVLICFNPVDIVYARMARHYAWLFESILLFALWVRLSAPTWWLALLSALMGFGHIFALIPIWVIMGIEFVGERKRKRLFSVLGCSLVIVVYYAVRFFVFGGEKVVSNVSWNDFTLLSFLKSLVVLPLGDAYPRHQFFPVPFALAATVLALAQVILIWKRPQSAKIFWLTLLLSLLAVESAGFLGVNLRVSRYLIYLVPLLIIGVVDSLQAMKEWVVYPVMLLSFLFLAWSNPLLTYPWDREGVKEWQAFSANHPDLPKLVCANPYQIEYYGFPNIHPCSNYLTQLDPSQGLLYFDLNGNDRMLSLYLHEKLKLGAFKTHRQSLMVRFDPR